MKKHRILVALLLIVASSMAAAVPPSGTGGGYYGSAWFDSGQGFVVGPYSSWAACNQAYQDALAYDVNIRGWTVVSTSPCSYRPPYGMATPNHKLSYAVDDSDPGASLDHVQRIVEKVRQLRETHMIDEYEAELLRIE
ncbi:hypothetical protein [Wenzhouxiangella sediminis]|uniref:DUF4189 domain-containing protein n=1 Tax=Wenzhouxiangella sediminis TaxID=1792836 RepID=A0A3E1KAQ6_9GAMM|nr:hypothetical protein [Wenzhouxiangella sediminis]RFF31543.1 hypothetical protein DZC52_04070 [Wenzhouxiangella sediminis]